MPPDSRRTEGDSVAEVGQARKVRVRFRPVADIPDRRLQVAMGVHGSCHCGCGTQWQSLGEDFGKMGINARLLDDFAESTDEIRKFDNAD